jgi:hypothetical protein
MHLRRKRGFVTTVKIEQTGPWLLAFWNLERAAFSTRIFKYIFDYQ